jgi:hypothetical protein
MKVSNWRKKLAATLVAGGLISPAVAQAANLDTNLVANPGFETVDGGVTGDYGAPKILSWSGGNAFAYSHNGTSGVPDYADGVDPPGAGNWYFTSNNNPDETDWNAPGDVFQDISVSAGATGTQIATGEAAVRLSAYMSSYLTQSDFGVLHVEFRNAGGTTLGSTQVVDRDPGSGNVWSRTSGATVVPAGTATLRVSVFGLPQQEGAGADGYIDNVDVQVTNASNAFVYAQVNTTTGQVSIRNQTGQAVPFDYYEITSASGALVRASWSSLQDQNLPGLPAGNGSGNGWEEGGGGGNGAISESYLTGSSNVANNANVGLGNLFNTAGAHDLVFRYGTIGSKVNSADFDLDEDVDGADFLAWQRGLGKNTDVVRADGDADGDTDGNGPNPAIVDGADLAIWKAGAQSQSTLVTGFVRYVTSGAAGVPEPGSVVIACMGLGVLAATRRRGGSAD